MKGLGVLRGWCAFKDSGGVGVHLRIREGFVCFQGFGQRIPKRHRTHVGHAKLEAQLCVGVCVILGIGPSRVATQQQYTLRNH